MTLLMLAIGFMAQLFFSARVLIQWLMSEKNHKVLSPTIFWFLSLAGSFLLFVYGWMRNDFAIIMGQMIAYYIYIGNLKLKDAWSKIPLALRYFLLLIPLAALIATLSDFSRFIELFFKNEDIPLWLLTIGITGQIIFTCRFIYQWLYSKRQH